MNCIGGRGEWEMRERHTCVQSTSCVILVKLLSLSEPYFSLVNGIITPSPIFSCCENNRTCHMYSAWDMGGADSVVSVFVFYSLLIM